LNCVNTLTRVVGKVFIACVFFLTSVVVTYFYYCFIPYKFNFADPLSFLFHFFTGNYLLINIIFHYYQAVVTNPGIVTNTPKIERSEISYLRENYNYRICKHCAQIKPGRAYHCSVCDCCILKMEHHCPWINNCVGMMNHKFYLLFCIFMWSGTFYILVSAWPLFSHCYRSPHGSINFDEKLQAWIMSYTENSQSGFRMLVVFAWIVCLSVFIALGILVVWQSWLVSFGETSVERMKLSYERQKAKKQGKKFASPFDYGLKQNWMNVLGYGNFKEFCMYVLLPSTKRGSDCYQNVKYTLKPMDPL